MREVEHRSSSYRSRHTSRSKSRDRERDRGDYYSRRRRSKSRTKTSKPKKKKSKKKRSRRSSSSSSATSKTSSRSRGSMKSSGSSIRRTTQPPSSEESSVQAKEISILSDVPGRIEIDKIEEDSFTAKPFFSTAESKKIPEKVVIDLENDTISVEGKVDDKKPEQSEIFHPNFLTDDMRKMEKWIKKLYNYRQKAFHE